MVTPQITVLCVHTLLKNVPCVLVHSQSTNRPGLATAQHATVSRRTDESTPSSLPTSLFHWYKYRPQAVEVATQSVPQLHQDSIDHISEDQSSDSAAMVE